MPSTRSLVSSIRALAPAALLAAAACGTGDIDLDPGDTLHPNDANAAPVDASVISADTLPEGMAPEALLAWREARQALRDASTVLSLGADDAGPQLFGAITGVEVDPHGNVYVLDMSAQEVRVFDSGGRHTGGFGGVGDGPMELRDAASLTLLSDGRVVVPTARRLKVFVESEDGWELDTLVATPFAADDVCTGERNDIFVSDYHRESDEALHRVSLKDDSALGVSAPYSDDNWLVRWRMTEGLIACLANQRQLAYAQFATPLVRAYSEDAELLWTARVEGHQTLRLRERAAGSVSLQRHMEHDLLTFLSALPSGHYVVQYHRYRRRRPIRLTTYLVDAATGIGASLGDALPPIAAVYDGGYVAVFREPYPRLEVRRFRTPTHNQGDPT